MMFDTDIYYHRDASLALCELAYSCILAVDEGEADVHILIPAETSGDTMPLTCEGSPVGEVVNSGDGGTVARFNPADVLSYLKAEGVVKIREGERE